jgi:hypothetical protein
MIPASRVALLSSIQVNDRGKAAPAVPYRRSDLVLWPEPEAILPAGGVRCLRSTCRPSVGPNPRLVTLADSRPEKMMQRSSENDVEHGGEETTIPAQDALRTESSLKAATRA